ncbi:hypothetical protein UFOVP1590_57 [uncultured Caudovirales phage]|uniref:Holin of 3TMs, for gene-transfer release n=1 Tax=uncultured Caudovirales phage TaxID=2100421 RepID=A0A6J5SSI3_9CAUD|nr:hypothetical protein UFOVP1590_57 [uncultured Caudovirales phage]
MSVLLATLLSSLIPVGVEGVKQLIATKMGGVKALTIDEQIKLDDHEIDRIKALAALDTPGGTPSQWIIDLRAASRYVAAWACIGIGAAMMTTPELINVGSELISVAFGFLFGVRMTAAWTKK